MTIDIKGDKKSYMLALLSFILVGLLIMWYYDHRAMVHELSEQIENSAGKDVIIKRWKDQADREHVVSEMRQVSLKELKSSQDSFMVAIRKEVGNLKNLVSRTDVKVTTTGQVAAGVKDTIVNVIEGKPVYAKTFDYRDEWLSMRGTILLDSAKINY